jgi:hypothetical protein
MACRSRQMEDAFILTRTWPGPGSGSKIAHTEPGARGLDRLEGAAPQDIAFHLLPGFLMRSCRGS